MFRPVLLVLLLLPIVAFLSCGESQTPLTSKTNPCALVTDAEAERALGEPVQSAMRSDPATCVFAARRNPANAVTVQVDETPGKDHRAWFNKERLRRDSHLIPSLADGAVRIDSPPSLVRLTFIHGDALVTVMVASMKTVDIQESVTLLGKGAATRYGTLALAAANRGPAAATPSPMTGSNQPASSATQLRTAPATMTQSLPAASGTTTGPTKSGPADLAGLVGTWHAHSSQGTTKYDLLLVIQPNRAWSLTSMTQFDGVLNADAGRWALERANTFNGLAWKGTYQGTTAHSFATTGSIRATWARLEADQPPSRIPAELWQLRREATSVPVFQIKTVEPDLVGQWEGIGTYAGGTASFVWSIKPSGAADLLIVDTTRGTLGVKAGFPQLAPANKKQRPVGVVAFHESGFTTNDGKTSIRWIRDSPGQPQDRQL